MPQTHTKINFIVATRGSLLASTQTGQTVDAIKNENTDCSFDISILRTQGDNVADKPLVSFGGTGVFVKELENALLDNTADFAVHSLKDVPSKCPEGLILACFPKRENVSDLFLTRNNQTIHQVPKNIKIGTGSPRRIIQLRNILPEATFSDLRGNIDTRFRKLEEGQYDAIILAAAGMRRLGKQIHKNAYLKVTEMLPAIGQGAIAIECRADDKRTIEVIRKINHAETELAVKTERVFMAEIEGGCKFPLAAYAQVFDNKVELTVLAGELKSGRFIKATNTTTFEKAFDLAKKMANELLEECNKQDIKLYDLGI
ncbi:MAG: hydroxymethylbilane synthase [Bacteroidetes bacterium GWA2_30_7]|nr:MAG: hydroxymethylbilane synthase [Bacteroidetes bacterium GWA2_30_7]